MRSRSGRGPSNEFPGVWAVEESLVCTWAAGLVFCCVACLESIGLKGLID